MYSMVGKRWRGINSLRNDKQIHVILKRRVLKTLRLASNFETMPNPRTAV